MQLVGRQRITPLQLRLDLADRIGVQQLAQVARSQQLGQQRPVEHQRLRAALGQRRVALVHVGGDVVEQQRAGERRRPRRLHLHQPHVAAADSRQQLPQRRQLEHV